MRLSNPHASARPPRRAAYALPTLFTAGNLLLGFIAILRAFQAAVHGAAGQSGPSEDLAVAAKAIGFAVALDGLDGRIARMTNTVSDFGREMDSLADVITFGVAPAVLAYTWGVQFMQPGGLLPDHRVGYLLCFLFLLCGSVRLARFNVQTNPVPKNPGRLGRKYFVGLPIPAGAGMLAAVVFACDSDPLHWWVYGALWLALIGLLSFLMVSTWRYPSFKEIHFSGPRSPLIVILIAALISLIWIYPQPMLLALSVAYVGSGILLRAGGLIRRRFRHAPPRSTDAQQHPEEQLG
ncbi:MAG: CDP-diacylglycerol--serine O-phosphatidyltransferase [Acidobacteriota bacterium]|nr:CDP-diacylglycerol--serine O-phosphatidyltransferase [Acidobacteriota bacterium]